jgi:hypothetical protein
LSRLNHAVLANRLLVPALFILAALTARSARADVSVDTGYQSSGIAPRLEFELGPQFAWGLGHACRDEPVASDAPATASCTSGLPMLGGQAVVLVRPFAHWALGGLFAYDAVLGAHEVNIDEKGTTKASYARSSQRLAFQLRWYSRSVSTSGLYIAAHAGALWWSDKVKPITEEPVSQLAPEFGLELGGVFAPYRGLGTTLGLQAWMAWLRNSPQTTSESYGSIYGYGPFVFIGLVMRLELGISL